MFVVNDDLSVYVTRGDYCNIPIAHQFQSGDVVRFKVTKKKDCNTVVLQRDFVVESATETFVISLTGTDTKIGEVISKPTDFWYEVELNPETNPQTIIGYDEDGAKILKLFPEGKDVDAEDIEVVGTKTLQELVDYALDQANKSGAFDGKDGQDGADGKDGQDGYTPVKGKDYFTEEDKNEIVADVAEEVLPNCTNALKATASGEVVRVDDVSPIEHTANVFVRGKNYVNMSKLLNGNLVDNGDGSYTLTKIDGTRFSAEYILNRPIPAGTLITASIASYVGTAPTMTIQVLKADRKEMYYFVVNASAKVKSTTLPYDVARVRVCFNSSEADGVSATFSGLQLEVGEATEYVPYVDPTTVEVTRCGKNLVPYPFYNKTKTENGITFTDNGNGIITVNGTATDNAFFHFVIDSTTRVKGVYTLSGLSGGSGTTYYIQPFISGTAVRGLTNGSYLYEFDGILDKITMVVVKGTTIDNLEVKLQLEQGNKATDFESYKVEEYTPDADGTCDIIPVSPTMTIFSNTPGANIKVEYNQDTNKAMEDVHADLRELDNAVAELAGSADAVLYTPQTLTDEQKAQARENIGAAKAEEEIVIVWKQGNIDSYGTEKEATNRLITNVLNVGVGTKVSIKAESGYGFVRRYFDESGAYVTGDTAWQTNVSFASTYPKLRVAMRKDTNDTIAVSESNKVSITIANAPTSGRWYGKTWLTLGDSITARGWYQDLIADRTGLEYVNYGIGGTMIAKKYDSTTNAFCTRYAEMQDDCDIVTVWGGVNDFISAIPLGTKGDTSEKTFYGALKVLIEGLLQKYPLKKIGFFLTTPINHTDTTLQYRYDVENANGNTLEEFCNAVSEMCADYSIPICDLYRNSGFNQYNIATMTSNVAETAPDGLHPSRFGYEFIMHRMLNFINNI